MSSTIDSASPVAPTNSGPDEEEEPGLTDRLREGFDRFLEHTADCSAGILSGVGVVDIPPGFRNDQTHAVCKALGATGAIVADAAIFAEGAALTGGGVTVSATGVGAVVGVPATAAGVGVMTVAAGGMVLHATNLGESINQIRTSSNTGGGSGPQQVEQVRDHTSLERARNQTLEEIGDLGHDRVPTRGNLHAAEDRINGFQSADGKRGFRIDFDPDKGIHYNWYDWTGGNRGSGGRWGAETFPGTEADYLRLLDQLNR